MGHISMSYIAKEEEVFIDTWERGKDGPDWKRVSLEEASATPDKIILCSVPGCVLPAKVLDHFYPYHSEMNRCDKHRST